MKLNVGLFSLLIMVLTLSVAHAEEPRPGALIAVPIIAQLVEQGEEGQWSGPLVDVLNEVESKSGLDLDIHIRPFKTVVKMTKDGQADFGVFMENAKRNAMALPIMKVADSTFVIISRTDEPIAHLSDLAGKTVGRVKGGLKVNGLSAIPDMTYYHFDGHNDGVKLLKAGRVDALLTADFRVLDAIAKNTLAYKDIARPIPVEKREIWLYWSWQSNLDFSLVKAMKQDLQGSVKGVDAARLFNLYDLNAQASVSQ